MINFKKPSLFTHSPVKRASETILHGGVLAVWGSPNAGKTTLAVKLALALAKAGKDTALLFTDMTTPMVPCICPPKAIEAPRSLGSILAATHVTQALVEYNMMTLKQYEHLTLIGMLKGENEYTYAPYTRTQAEELIDVLRKIVPFVIIDCSSYIANDILSAIALLKSDAVFRLSTWDLKSVSYLSSQLKLLESSDWDLDKQYKVISHIRGESVALKAHPTLGEAAFTLPYSDEIAQQFLEGDFLKPLHFKASKGYKKTLDKMIKEVFGC